MSVTTVYDATHANIGHLPAGMAAGYATGTGDVPWTEADWKAHPGALRIDQTPANTAWDGTADIDDYENGAVTLAELAVRAKKRAVSFKAGTHPGQREPVVYAAKNNLTPVVNALIAGGVTSGVGLWVADWSLTLAEATAMVEGASGPFPVRGVQWHNAGLYDVSVFDPAYLAAVSRAPVPAAQPNPLGAIQADWRFCVKCGCLVHAPEAGSLPCAGGGRHEPRSHDYVLYMNDRM